MEFPTQPPTPPNSISGSPVVKTEAQEFTSLVRPYNLVSPPRSASVRLPSLESFDQEVEALIRENRPPKTPASVSPLDHCAVGGPANSHPTSQRGTGTGPSQDRFSLNYSLHSWQISYGKRDKHLGNDASTPSLQDQPSMICYPRPAREVKKRHVNQKYTIEEGDYIIYASQDKKMKWHRIKEEFAKLFGNIPERTVQGLQAWYYRMDQRIPMCDPDGRLCFNNEDDLEPRYINLKICDRGYLVKCIGPLGIAQRYPERAVQYSWVDAETKAKARDLGTYPLLLHNDDRLK
ncbi:hypothetical protein Forpi1262_v014255 [Fusarium oxysporum f. sp. raphani]|uniref:Uncharacterized protein n=1 Tax=Fusarium oxysporum f. sp. raphani TaxID=96318 RepID=A0A8J5P249_FUSOX|nr:hypothetical protein Forpi1262_v017629 [Fusarium oxysporum f. sp. raphani]KAG7424547.1 hypothetical protein Forpi1262_v014255 [Fusarium oxysporum f. sp. raphani]